MTEGEYVLLRSFPFLHYHVRSEGQIVKKDPRLEPPLDGGKTYQYLSDESDENNPAIITREAFVAVQGEMQERNNIINPDGTKVRKDMHYSAKRNSRQIRMWCW